MTWEKLASICDPCLVRLWGRCRQKRQTLEVKTRSRTEPEGHAYPFMQAEASPAALGPEGLPPEPTGLGMRLLQLGSLLASTQRLLLDSGEMWASSSELEALLCSSSPEEKDEVPESILLLIQRLCCFCTRRRARSGGLKRRACAEKAEDSSEPDLSSEMRMGIRLRLLDFKGERPSGLLGRITEEFALVP